MATPTKMMRSHSWRDVDHNLDAAASYLDLVATIIAGFKSEANDALHLKPGDVVLEVGCGMGRDAEALAPRVAPGGRVIGTDLSTELIAQATSRVAPLGLALEFRVADAQALPFPDDHFDAARVERMLQHIPDAERAVHEMVRVVRPGGRVVAFEPDWDTVTASGGDIAVLRAIRRYSADVRLTAGRIGSATPHLLQQAGCVDLTIAVRTVPFMRLALADTVMFLSSSLSGAIDEGWITEADARDWWRVAAARDACGTFYGAMCGTIVAGTVT